MYDARDMRRYNMMERLSSSSSPSLSLVLSAVVLHSILQFYPSVLPSRSGIQWSFPLFSVSSLIWTRGALYSSWHYYTVVWSVWCVWCCMMLRRMCVSRENHLLKSHRIEIIREEVYWRSGWGVNWTDPLRLVSSTCVVRRDENNIMMNGGPGDPEGPSSPPPAASMAKPTSAGPSSSLRTETIPESPELEPEDNLVQETQVISPEARHASPQVSSPPASGTEEVLSPCSVSSPPSTLREGVRKSRVAPPHPVRKSRAMSSANIQHFLGSTASAARRSLAIRMPLVEMNENLTVNTPQFLTVSPAFSPRDRSRSPSPFPTEPTEDISGIRSPNFRGTRYSVDVKNFPSYLAKKRTSFGAKLTNLVEGIHQFIV